MCKCTCPVQLHKFNFREPHPTVFRTQAELQNLRQIGKNVDLPFGKEKGVRLKYLFCVVMNDHLMKLSMPIISSNALCVNYFSGKLIPELIKNQTKEGIVNVQQ